MSDDLPPGSSLRGGLLVAHGFVFGHPRVVAVPEPDEHADRTEDRERDHEQRRRGEDPIEQEAEPEEQDDDEGRVEAVTQRFAGVHLLVQRDGVLREELH